MSAVKRVLFVCLGNICRSPAAEGVFKKMVADRGLDGTLQADSAGTGDWHVGEPPDSRMREAALERGYELNGRGRQFTRWDFEDFDLILAMDRDNLRAIKSLDPSGKHVSKVRLFGDSVTSRSIRDVPDPYYGGPGGFEDVLDLIEEGCGNLVEELTTSP